MFVFDVTAIVEDTQNTNKTTNYKQHPFQRRSSMEQQQTASTNIFTTSSNEQYLPFKNNWNFSEQVVVCSFCSGFNLLFLIFCQSLEECIRRASRLVTASFVVLATYNYFQTIYMYVYHVLNSLLDCHSIMNFMKGCLNIYNMWIIIFKTVIICNYIFATIIYYLMFSSLSQIFEL